MISFERQNKPYTNANEQGGQSKTEQKDETLNKQALEERREQAQTALHESLKRLHVLGEEETTSQRVQDALREEVVNLESIEKDIAYLYSEYKKAKEEARIDSLTKLPNLRAFEEALEIKIERAKSDSAELYVLYIDIDDFKDVNDNFGHNVGNKYLQLISKYITYELRPDDMIARLGGDEFAVTIFLRNPHETSDDPFDHHEEADAIANRIYHAVSTAKSQLWEKFSTQGKDKMSESDFMSTIASIGGVRFDGVQDMNTLMKEADTMMYKIKKSGKSGVGWNSEQKEDVEDENIK